MSPACGTPASHLFGYLAVDVYVCSAAEVVSHYRIRRRLGAGGMGEVYLADDLTLKRQVAIKLLTSKDLTDDRVRKNLLREAQAAASLDHPNICSVHEVGTDGDLSFIVMQYVEGETLAERLKRSQLSSDESLDIATRVADALRRRIGRVLCIATSSHRTSC